MAAPVSPSTAAPERVASLSTAALAAPERVASFSTAALAAPPQRVVSFSAAAAPSARTGTFESFSRPTMPSDSAWTRPGDTGSLSGATVPWAARWWSQRDVKRGGRRRFASTFNASALPFTTKAEPGAPKLRDRLLLDSDALAVRLIVLAGVGLLAEVAAREFEFSGGPGVAFALRVVVSLSTAALLLYMYVMYSVEWLAVRMRTPRLYKEPAWPPMHTAACLAEMLVCAVHCPPGVHVGVDVGGHEVDNVWSLLMFARLYLLTRLVSRVYVRSLAITVMSIRPVSRGALTRGVLSSHPVLTIGSALVCIVTAASYSMHVCERPGDTEPTLADSIWLVCVTVFMVGYGEAGATPATSCGRTVSALAALSGAFGLTILTTSLHHAMYLSAQELPMVGFLDAARARERKRFAAAVLIQRAWRHSPGRGRPGAARTRISTARLAEAMIAFHALNEGTAVRGLRGSERKEVARIGRPKRVLNVRRDIDTPSASLHSAAQSAVLRLTSKLSALETPASPVLRSRTAYKRRASALSPGGASFLRTGSAQSSPATLAQRRGQKADAADALLKPLDASFLQPTPPPAPAPAPAMAQLATPPPKTRRLSALALLTGPRLSGPRLSLSAAEGATPPPLLSLKVRARRLSAAADTVLRDASATEGPPGPLDADRAAAAAGAAEPDAALLPVLRDLDRLATRCDSLRTAVAQLAAIAT